MRVQHGKEYGTLSRSRRKFGGARRTSLPRIEALEGRVLLASRLFALPLDQPSVITELDPHTGAEIHRFNAPTPADPNGENGLAFDGRVIYYMPHDNTDRLWELDPNTGSVIHSAQVGDGTGQFDGIGAVGGKVYLQDFVDDQLVVIDPASETVIGRLSVAADLLGGLTGADSPDELVATESLTTAVRIDPTTGAVLGRFPLPGPVFGAAFVDGNLYFGSSQRVGPSQSGQVYVTSRTGTLLSTLSIPYAVSALGGDGVEADSQPGTEQVVNGGFELGNLSGWHSFAQPSTFGQGFQVYSTAAPFGRPLPAPPQGQFAATDDLHGPGTEVLYQDVTLPAGQSAHLSMLLGYNNHAPGFITPNSLDSQSLPNQQFRVDVIDPNANPLSTAAGDVLLTVFQTKVGDPNTLAPTERDADLSAFAGRTVRLRIAVAENQLFLDTVVDAVSIQTSGEPPPPPTPGPYYVADPGLYGGGSGEVIRIDPANGAQTVVSSGGQFIDPYGVTVAPDGSLIVADHGTFGGTGTLFRVDPVTGAQSVITTGGYLVDPSGVIIAPDGSLLVADFASGVGGRIVRVDPATGRQTLLTIGDWLQGPFSLAIGPDRSIYVVDIGAAPGGIGEFIRIDPATGGQVLIPTDGMLSDPSGIVEAPDGTMIVSDSNAFGGQGAIFRIDPLTGNVSVISQGGLFQEPVGVALTSDGRLLVADADALGGSGALIAVDLATGAQSVISSGGNFINPLGVAVAPAATPPPVNTPPTASAGGPYTVEEGAAVTLDASGTTDPDQNPTSLTYLWDLNGNGVFGETGSAATNGDEVGLHPVFFAAGLPGASTWTVALEVTDAGGLKSLATSTITIDNRPPVVTLGPDATVEAAATFTAHGSFTDPGAGEDYRASVDYGDGAGLQVLPLNPDRTFDLSHVYARAGTYNVTVFVSDGNGGLGRSSLVVTATPLTPAFNALTGSSITYGQGVVTLGGRISGSAWTPAGSVFITLAGVTHAATIDPATGAFSAVFTTAMLGVQGSPYTVTYSYAGDGTYSPTTDTSQSLTVSPRALTLTTQDTSKVFGGPDPEFTATFDGFAPGEGPGVLGGSLAFATNEPAGNAPVGPYSITPSGLASPNYAIAYVPGTLAVIQATTSLSALSSPSVVIGTASTLFTGVLGSNSVLPVGQAVTVTIVGPNGPLASGTGTVGSDGRFSATIATASLPAGSYTVRYVYAGDHNFTSTEWTGNLAVIYNVPVLYDATKAHRAGSDVPIKIAVDDLSGNDLSSSNLVVTAVQIVDAQGTTYAPSAKGNSNPGGVFRKTGSKYAYNLDTSGLAPGKYTLLVTIGNDPVTHALTFVVG